MTWIRAAFLALLGYWTIRLGSGAATGCPLDLVNLAFHEAGHIFLTPFGETLHFLGGTIGQLVVPGGLAAYFLLRKRQPFAAAACAWWTGESLINVAVYMADARDLALPLVGGGHHDWNTLFYTFGLLGEDSVRRVAASTHVIGTVVMVAGLSWAASFLLSGRLRERFDAFVSDRAPALRPMFGAD